jgi:hypothetical protein
MTHLVAIVPPSAGLNRTDIGTVKSLDVASQVKIPAPR